MAIRNAIRRGELNKPSSCQKCLKGDCGRIEAHHFLGYGQRHWLDVVWLCPRCHDEEDIKARAEAPKSMPVHRREISDLIRARAEGTAAPDPASIRKTSRAVQDRIMDDADACTCPPHDQYCPIHGTARLAAAAQALDDEQAIAAMDAETPEQLAVAALDAKEEAGDRFDVDAQHDGRRM